MTCCRQAAGKKRQLSFLSAILEEFHIHSHCGEGGLKQLHPVEGGLVGGEGIALTAGLGVATQGPKLGVWPSRQLWA